MKYWEVARRYPPQTLARLIFDKVRRDSRHAWGRWRARTFGTKISAARYRAALTPEFGDEQAVVNWIRSGQGSTFFLHHSQRDQIIASIRNHFPDLEKNTIAAADQACAHVFDLLGSGPVNLGEQIHWHVDFKTGHRYDSHAYFADVHPAAYPGGHDIKVPWELSRFQHTAWLGEAYWFTNDEKYAREFVAQVTDWIEQNPPEFGVNWTTSMEAAIRAVNWLWGMAFFRESPLLTDDFLIKVVKSFLAHGRHIFHNLERHDTYTGNHYLADLVGLIFLGTFCPYFKEAENWRKFGTIELWKEMEKQVYPDGVDYEASIGYHRFVTEFFVAAFWLCDLNQFPVPPQARERLEKMLEFVLYYTKPDGTVPLFGDFDNGRLFRLKAWATDEREWLDHRYLLAIGAVLFDRDDFGQGASNQWEEAAWMLGERAIAAKTGLKAKSLPPLNLQSRSFPVGGIYIMRDRDLYVAVDAGPNGQNGNGGHAHNDSLSFELFAHGQSWVVDPGTYTYTADSEARNQFRSTRYHNNSLIDGREQSRFDARALFSLLDAPQLGVEIWRSTPEADMLSARYAVVLLGWVKRTFYLDKQQGCLIVRDEVSAAGVHTIESYLHCAPAQLTFSGNVASLEQARSALIVKMVAAESSGAFMGEVGSVSESYGRQISAPVLHFKSEFRDKATLYWILTPISETIDSELSVSSHSFLDMTYGQITEWFQVHL